jgi:hypothetical protein
MLHHAEAGRADAFRDCRDEEFVPPLETKKCSQKSHPNCPVARGNEISGYSGLKKLT